MSYLRRFIRFIFIHAFNNRHYLFTYTLHFFDSNYVPKVFYHELNELESIVRAGKSIIRFGDGEIYIMNGGSIHYQKFDSKLQKIFTEMVEKYNNESNYVLCLPREMIRRTNKQLRKENLLHCWLPMKVFFEIKFNHRAKYLDAFMFYVNETIPDYLEKYLKEKQVIVATNKSNIDNLKRNTSLPFSNICYIETPESNAFSEYEKIKNAIRTEVKKYGKENSVVLVSFGPASKAVAFEMSSEGYTLIDIGRGIEISYTEERLDHLLKPR